MGDTSDTTPLGGGGLSALGGAPLVGWLDLCVLFLMFLFVSSDVCVNSVLSPIDGATLGRAPTTKGVVMQGLLLVLAFGAYIAAQNT